MVCITPMVLRRVLRRCRVGSRVQDATDDHIRDFTTVRMKRIVGSAWHPAHLRVRPLSRISRENGELRTLPLGELPPLQLSEGHHYRYLPARRHRSRTHGPMSRHRRKTTSYETQEETIHLDLPLTSFKVPIPHPVRSDRGGRARRVAPERDPPKPAVAGPPSGQRRVVELTIVDGRTSRSPAVRDSDGHGAGAGLPLGVGRHEVDVVDTAIAAAGTFGSQKGS